MSHTIQYVAIGAIVTTSMVAVIRHFFPQATRAVIQRFLDELVRRGIAVPGRWRNRIPVVSGCATGCGTCSSSQCANPGQVAPVRLHRGKSKVS
ncbi:DUF6587 family protein [Pandoraea apista]|uniref:DUF6587 family protein n=1 Tax=Pandoraea apista TaxID=93218 RepID=UPI0039BF6CF4